MAFRRIAALKAFTLIELLIIVALIGILARIAVPNFLEAQVRAKSARARSDLAFLRAGIHAYYADYQVYPLHHPEVLAFLKACTRTDLPFKLATPENALFSWTLNDPKLRERRESIFAYSPRNYGSPTPIGFPILNATAGDLTVLTTPVAYIAGALPQDAFGETFCYPYINLSILPESTDGTRRSRGFLLTSVGPATERRERVTSTMVNPVRGPYIPYDPTNGTVSAGDYTFFGVGEENRVPFAWDLAIDAYPDGPPY